MSKSILKGTYNKNNTERKHTNPSTRLTWCLRVSIPAQTSWPRSKLGRKGFIQLTHPYCCSSLKEVSTGNQADQKAGADAEAIEGWSLLAYFPGLLSLLSYRTQDYQPRDGPTHNGPFPPWSLIEKMPYNWISWRHFLNWSSFFW